VQIKNDAPFDLTLVHPREDVVDVFEFSFPTIAFTLPAGGPSGARLCR
jgi:hypothetical protein